MHGEAGKVLLGLSGQAFLLCDARAKRSACLARHREGAGGRIEASGEASSTKRAHRLAVLSRRHPFFESRKKPKSIPSLVPLLLVAQPTTTKHPDVTRRPVNERLETLGDAWLNYYAGFVVFQARSVRRGA